MFARMLAWDQDTLLRIHLFESPFLTALARALTRLGDASGWLAVALLCAALDVDAVPVALTILKATAVATVLAQVLKRSLRRARPSRGCAGVRVTTPDPDAFSFPSGHTAAAASVAAALLLAGSPLALPFVVLALGIAVSRVHLGAHYPLDVAAGALVGIVAALLAHVLDLAVFA